MNFFFMTDSIHWLSLKCFSRIIVNLRKTYKPFATCLEIYLSAPKTDESVSSINDIIDFLKPLFDELMLLILLLRSNFFELIVFLRGLEFLKRLN